MKTYHVCECCDRVYKTTESYDAHRSDLTDESAEGIIMEEFENGNKIAAGLCDDCREEVYGASDRLIYPYYRLH